jgi:hypothetical protein
MAFGLGMKTESVRLNKNMWDGYIFFFEVYT